MSDYDCNACNDLQANAPAFYVNGVTTAVCNSLKNDTGLATNNGNNNETDMNDVNDCYVGRAVDELEAYDNCEWKGYMKMFLPHLYEELKAMICSASGLWTASHLHDCQINALALGTTFSFSVTAESSESNVVAGEGVSLLERRAQDVDPGEEVPDVQIQYIAGGLARGIGALAFHTEQFTEPDGTVRAGNPVWGQTGDTANGNELIYEIRIKRSQYPQVRAFFGGFGQENNGGAFHVTCSITNAGDYAPGQHGGCNSKTGEPVEPGLSSGHLVPEGWTYIQLRMSYIWDMINTGGNTALVTPMYFFGMRMNPSAIDC